MTDLTLTHMLKDFRRLASYVEDNAKMFAKDARARDGILPKSDWLREDVA